MLGSPSRASARSQLPKLYLPVFLSNQPHVFVAHTRGPGANEFRRWVQKNISLRNGRCVACSYCVFPESTRLAKLCVAYASIVTYTTMNANVPRSTRVPLMNPRQQREPQHRLRPLPDSHHPCVAPYHDHLRKLSPGHF